MKSSVITFPGSNCDRDMDVALKKFGFKNKMVWHDDVELPKSDLVVLPGGFSYGDYLRCGSMASKSKIMKSVINFANSGGMVMGICNGFQILVETGLVPGVLLRNKYLEFICKNVFVKINNKQNTYFKNIDKSQVFEKSLEYISKKRGDLGLTYKKYHEFIKPVFDGNEHFDEKLLNLACVLSHMDWGLGAFQKAELVFQETLNTPLLRLSHKERIQIALSCYWRYCSIKYNPKIEYLTFLNNNEIFSSKQVGSALRFAHSLTSISTIFLEEFKLYRRGNSVFLKIPSQHQEIISKQVTKKFKALARELFLEPRVIYSNNLA